MVPQGVWLAPVAVAPEAGLIEVAGLFRTHEFPSIPVVRSGGMLAGVILQIDLIRRAGAEALHAPGLCAAGAARTAAADGGGYHAGGDAACHACDVGGRAVAVDGRRRGRGGAGGG